MNATTEHPHAADPAELCASLGTRPNTGIKWEDARARLEREGPNRLPAQPPPTRAALLGRQLGNAMVLLLAAAAAISLAIGELVDAAVILAIVVANAVLGYVQEGRAESAARSLRKLMAPRALVVREGVPAEVVADELVVGDIVLLRAGDRVPADGRVVEAVRLDVDESLLTGESLPVHKRAAPAAAADAPITGQATMVFAGTTVTRGSGRFVVTATGAATQVGRIATAAEQVQLERTPLQARLDRLAGLLLKAAGAVCVGLALLSYLYGEDLGQSLLIGVSLAVAAVPEGLPAVVTIVLAIGMRRMAERGAIVRRLQAVETLGSTTVICADKTGTLTENRMTVTAVYVCRSGAEADLGSAVHRESIARVLTAAMLASEPPAIAEWTGGRATDAGGPGAPALADPTEAAILDAATALEVPVDELVGGRHIVAVEPFDAERKRMSVVVEEADGTRTSYAKGAPEVLIPRLAEDEADPATLAGVVDRWAGEGMRVLLVARRIGLGASDDPEAELEPLALLGLADPPRPASRPSVAEARAAGIRTVMVTGDHPRTAMAIARATSIGGGREIDVVTGTDLDRLSDAELARRAREVSVYARVVPAHKLRIVEALKRDGEVVAMTGDGVNDVPALKAAHIGVAMGRRGSDAAAAASEMVLTDDEYATIVHATRRGRTIHDNVVRFVHFLLAANAGELLVFALAITLGLSAPLTVLQILMVNLLTDGLPAIALGVDPPDPRVMRRPPRPRTEGLLDPIRGRLVTGGLAMGLAAFAAFLIGHAAGQPAAQTMAFTTLVFAQLTHVFATRGDDWFFRAGRNLHLLGAVLLSGLVQVAVLAVPPIAERFDVVPLSATQLAAALALSLVPFVAVEAHKALRRSAHPKPLV